MLSRCQSLSQRNMKLNYIAIIDYPLENTCRERGRTKKTISWIFSIFMIELQSKGNLYLYFGEKGWCLMSRPNTRQEMTAEGSWPFPGTSDDNNRQTKSGKRRRVLTNNDSIHWYWYSIYRYKLLQALVVSCESMKIWKFGEIL